MSDFGLMVGIWPWMKRYSGPAKRLAAPRRFVTMALLVALFPTAFGLFVLSRAGDVDSGAALFVLVGLIATIAIHPHLVAMLSRSPGRVLFLRNFRSETRPIPTVREGAHDAEAERSFSSIEALHDLAGLGFDVVTLRDPSLRSDERTGFSVAVWPVVGVTIIVVWAAALAVPLGLVALAIRFDVANPLTILGSILLGLVLAGLGGSYGTGWVLRQLRIGLRARSGGRRVPLRRLARPLRRPWQLGMTIVIAGDNDWKAYVDALVRRADHIVIDLRAPSPHIAEELAIIAARRADDKIVWLLPEDRAVAPAPMESGYAAMGQRFTGTPRILEHPKHRTEASKFASDLVALVV